MDTRLGPRWQAVLAVLLPVALSAMFVLTMARPIPPGRQARSSSYARTANERLRQLEERLAQHPAASVVVVGNSTAGAGVLPSVLAERLGMAGDGTKATLPSASPLTWYAMLKHLVYASGLRPELVVLVAPPAAYWVTQPTSEYDVHSLLELAGTTDPIVNDWWWGRRPGTFLLPMDLRRRTWRAAALDAGTRWALQGVPEAVRENTLDRTFLGRVATRDPLGAPGLKPGDQGELLERPSADLDVEATLLPALVQLVHDAGGELVCADIAVQEASLTLPDEDSRALALERWLGSVNSTFLTMGDVDLRPEHFDDRFHLTEEGAGVYTRQLARRIGDWQVGLR